MSVIQFLQAGITLPIVSFTNNLPEHLEHLGALVLIKKLKGGRSPKDIDCIKSINISCGMLVMLLYLGRSNVDDWST